MFFLNTDEEDAGMIDRYTLKGMGDIWEDEARFRNWLNIEVLACEAQAALGLIPKADLKNIQERADFNTERILEIEEVVKHDVIAFLTAVGEKVGDSSKYIHMGLTSSDILDTGLSLQMVQASDILLKKLHRLRKVLAEKAKTYKYTIQAGRSHGVHAEPITFGLKLALWTMEVDRSIERMNQARETIAVGQISGAVGTMANVDPSVEEYVCEKLDLKPALISTQVIQRDRHAQYVSTLAVIASSLDKFATELRALQKTETLEVEEMFSKGQKGSSAMPHKKNPITGERISGLARVIRGHAVAAMENVALWHERDISHSSVERIILPDATILLDYMLEKTIVLLEGLVVYEENMRRNLDLTLGLMFSQKLMLALVGKGLLRETAYAWVQKDAMEAWETKVEFKEIVKNDMDIMDKISPEEMDEIFDYDAYLVHIDYLFKRAGLE